jgi:hypothetical protein
MASCTPVRPRAHQTAEEVGPKRLGLGLADVEAENLAPAGLVHAVRDHQRLLHAAAAVADLLDLRVQEQVRVAALQRAPAERLDVLIQGLTHAADLLPLILSPRLSTSWSTRGVETPQT